MGMDGNLSTSQPDTDPSSLDNLGVFKNVKTFKIFHNPSQQLQLQQQIELNSHGNSEISANESSYVRTAMDTYLKKHKLDLTLLPNKKIKLSDLRSLSNTSNNSIEYNQSELNTIQPTTTTTNTNTTTSSTVNVIVTVVDEDALSTVNSSENTDQSDSEMNDDLEELQHAPTEEDCDLRRSDLEGINSSASVIEAKRSRKKREPSLKLQQKLSNEDLELIVNNVRSMNASVSIADVKKDNYIDKILKVELLDSNIVLSNGKKEALLKKSMFPKELNTLFDSFVNALFAQKQLLDENGNVKPTLTCLVVECDYKSFSEAEIMRHIKRHLAQDGYTCSKCSHQFASMTNLQRHLRIHAGDVGKEIKCPECDYKASTITHIKRHMAHKHLERALPCPHCSFMGATNAELKIHMSRKHLELTGKNPLFLPKYLRKDYQCSVCKEQYNDFKEYQAHVYEHTSSSNRFQCSECPYNCKNYSKLKRHMLYHTGARNYSCELCNNKFFQMEHLKRHMQSIHNIVSPATPANLVQYPPDNKPKTVKQSVNNKKQRAGPYSKKTPGFARQGPVLTTIANEEDTANSINSYQTEHHCFKVSSRCMYKCHQCEFVSVNLYTLNQHLLSKHSRYQDLDSQVNSDSFLSDESEAKNFSYNEETNDGDSDFNFKAEHQFFNESNLNEQALNEYFICSFCTYKTDQKLNLKRHLHSKHSSQPVAPILLSNDPIITGSGTRFQCSTCLSYAANVNEYTKHMDEKHSIQVYILDLNSGVSLQEQLQTKGRAEIMSTSAITDLLQSQAANNLQSRNNSLNQKQQLKNFINSSNSLQARYHNQQHTTVRINPLIFKRTQNFLTAKTPQQQPQTCNMNIVQLNHQLVKNNDLDSRSQQPQQMFNSVDVGHHHNHHSIMAFSKDAEIDFENLNETAEQLGIIVNEFQ